MVDSEILPFIRQDLIFAVGLLTARLGLSLINLTTFRLTFSH